MGQVTRTNFGCTARADITNAQIIAAPTAIAPVTLVAAIPGEILVPLFVFARLSWVADYGTIDATAQLIINVGTTLWMLADNTVASAVTNTLAAGEAASMFAPVAGRTTAGAVLVGLGGYLDGDVVNKPITFSATNGAAGNFTGGDVGNSLAVTVFYCVVPV